MRFRPYLGHGHDRHVHVASKPKPFAVDLFAIAVLPHLYQQSNVALVFACDRSKMPLVSLLSVEVSTAILFMHADGKNPSTPRKKKKKIVLSLQCVRIIWKRNCSTP